MEQEEKDSPFLPTSRCHNEVSDAVKPVDQQTISQSNPELRYKKRPGTSGIDGQLYETKLLCLVLLRALKKKEINEFYLATNADEIGVFDDIVLRYESEGQDKPKIIFVQAKHRDNPTKTKVTVEEMFKDNSDFNLFEFFCSYCLIRNKFSQDSVNETDKFIIFQGQFDNVDCEFILYTSANEKFNRKKFSEQQHITTQDDLLYTKSSGCTFQFDFESKDVDDLIEKFKDSKFSKTKKFDDKNLKSWIEDFLSKLKFYTNQAKQVAVEKIVKENVDIYFNKVNNSDVFRIETDAIFLKVYDNIQSWWKHRKGTCLTKRFDLNFFEKVKNEIAECPLLDKLSFMFTMTIQNLDIEFNNNAIQAFGFDNVMKTTEKIITIISDEITLSCIKVLQYFKQTDCDGLNVNHAFIDLSCFDRGVSLEKVVFELKKTKIKIILVVCAALKLANSLKNIIDNIDQKIILITNDFFYKEFMSVYPIVTIEIKDMQNRLVDLSSVSQSSMAKRTVTFQGEVIDLGTVLDEKSKQLIHSEVLLTIASYENIELGNLLSTLSDEIDSLKDYYVHRSISRCIKLKPTKEWNGEFYFFDKNKSEQDLKDNHDIIVVTGDHKEFEATLIKYGDRNVHWFENEEEGFIWKKTIGKLEKLFQYVIRDQHPSYCLEPNTVKEVQDEVVIIVGEPGMGKSSLMRHVFSETKQRYPNMWVMLINLRDHGKIFNKWTSKQFKMDKVEAVKFLCYAGNFQACINDKQTPTRNVQSFQIVISGRRISLETTGDIKGQALLELELFIHMYNEGNVFILFDGFDESVDYKDEVIALLQTLKDSDVRFWITSRTYNFHNELENQLSIFSYSLEALTLSKQKDYLGNFWKKYVSYVASEKFHSKNSFVDAFFDWVSKIDDKKIEFTGMAQHLYMVAEIFLKENCWPSKNETLSLVALYKHFISVKCQIYEDKILQPDFAKTSGGKRIIKILRNDFLENHKKMAALVIFGKSGLTMLGGPQVISNLNDYITELRQDGESTGIVEKIVENKPGFIHLTYAEYFASEYISDQLKLRPDKKFIWSFVFERLLISNKQGVKRFFDSKLGNDSELADVTSRSYVKKIVFSNLKVRANYEFSSITIPYYSKKPRYLVTSSALYIAIEEDLINVVNILLSSVEGCLNKNNLEEFVQVIRRRNYATCVLCAAVRKKNKQAIIKIIDLISSVDCSKLAAIFNCDDDDVPYSDPSVFAGWMFYDKNLVDILLTHLLR